MSLTGGNDPPAAPGSSEECSRGMLGWSWCAALPGSSSAGEKQSLLSIPVDEQLSSVFLCEHLLEPQLPSLGATGAQETQPQAPFCFPCLSVAFFVHLPFYQGPCGVNCWSPAWPLSRSSPRGFPCAYVFAVTLSTAYSTLGLARSLTGFLLQGLLLPNLGFFFSAFYSDLWIKNGKFHDMLSVFPAGNASGKLSLSQGKSTAFWLYHSGDVVSY